MTAVRSCSLRAAPDARLHLEGDGKHDLLMLHGLGYAGWEAHPLRNALDGRLGLWSLDNRGTGRSERGAHPITMDRLALDAIAAIEELGPPITLVGHSMGGYIALTAAVRRPDLVADLVLIGTSAGGRLATPVPDETLATWAASADASPPVYARRTMPLSFAPGWTDRHPDSFAHLLEARLRHPTEPEIWREQFGAAQAFLESGISAEAITARTLVIHGSLDRVVPVENGRALAQAIPRSDYHEVPDAGHLVHLEQPDHVARLISSFVRSPLT